MSRKFDRFMVAVEISSNPKIGRLTAPEFRCLVAGVWPLAAKAPIRGRLLIGNLEVEPRDVAHQARCSESIAKATLRKLRDLGMIEPDPEFGCERVHDWNDVNPEPKKDATAAERQQRRRDRLRDARRDAGVTPVTVTPPEVEVEEKELPSGSSLVNLAQSNEVQIVFDGWVEATGRDKARTKLSPERRSRIETALASHGLDDCLAAVRNIGADPWARGANDRNKRFDDIDHALGNAKRIEGWRDQPSAAANGSSTSIADRGAELLREHLRSAA